MVTPAKTLSLGLVQFRVIAVSPIVAVASLTLLTSSFRIVPVAKLFAKIIFGLVGVSRKLKVSSGSAVSSVAIFIEIVVLLASTGMVAVPVVAPAKSAKLAELGVVGII